MHHAGGAHFDFISITRGIPLIHDLGGRVSVTNAAEAVIGCIMDILRPRHIQRPRAIIYRDSAGMYDALAIELGEYAGFYVLNAESPEAAYEQLASMLRRSTQGPVRAANYQDAER